MSSVSNFTIVNAELALQVQGTDVTDEVLALPEMIDSDGDITLSDTQWEDLRFSAAGINPPGGVSDPDRDTADGRLAFAASSTEIIALQVQLPHSWKEGSQIKPHIHWSPTSTNEGDVLWKMQYKIANIGETFPSEWSELTVLDTGSGTVDDHLLADLGGIEMAGKKISCMMLVLLSRVGDDETDTYTADAKLNEFDIHYQIDSFGSKEETTK